MKNILLAGIILMLLNGCENAATPDFSDNFNDLQWLTDAGFHPDSGCIKIRSGKTYFTYPGGSPLASILDSHEEIITQSYSNALFTDNNAGDARITFRPSLLNTQLITAIPVDLQIDGNVLTGTYNDTSFYMDVNTSIRNITAEVTVQIISTSPVTIKIDFKILQGELVNNGHLYDLGQGDIHYIKELTFLYQEPCCPYMQDYADRTYTGAFSLYTYHNNDTLYNHIPDTLVTGNVSPGFSWLDLDKLFQNYTEIWMNSVTSCSMLRPGTTLSEFYITPLTRIVNFHIDHGITLSNGELIMNMIITGILKTADPELSAMPTIDTSDIKQYVIAGLYRE